MIPLQKNKYFKKKRNNYRELGKVNGERVLCKNEGETSTIFLEELLEQE